LTLTPPIRAEVLTALWGDYGFLKDLREAIDQDRKKPSQKTKFQVYIIQVQASVCKAILQGLTDQEIELRVIELETKLANSILIPKEKEK
jgi:hypothetical protein